jgi:hypothetical protein
VACSASPFPGGAFLSPILQNSSIAFFVAPAHPSPSDYEFHRALDGDDHFVVVPVPRACRYNGIIVPVFEINSTLSHLILDFTIRCPITWKNPYTRQLDTTFATPRHAIVVF